MYTKFIIAFIIVLVAGSITPISGQEVFSIQEFASRLGPAGGTLEGSSSDAISWNNIGNDLLGQGRYDEAIQAYDEALRLDPSYATAIRNKAIAWNNKGESLFWQGEYDEAIYAFDESLRLDSNNAMAKSNKDIALNAKMSSTSERGRVQPETRIIEHSIAIKVDESNNDVIQEVSEFIQPNSFNEGAYSWLSLGMVGASRVEWLWYSPDGNVYARDTYQIPSPVYDYWDVYTVWSFMPISGEKAADLGGDWRVDIFLDGQMIMTEQFTLNIVRSVGPTTSKSSGKRQRTGGGSTKK
jgi:tetratricopeptide (TPR) repeat protein